MGKLRITLACGDHDRVAALKDGRIQPEGVDLTFVPLEPDHNRKTVEILSRYAVEQGMIEEAPPLRLFLRPTPWTHLRSESQRTCRFVLSCGRAVVGACFELA